MAIEIGTGTTITFDSGFFAEIQSISWTGISRESIPSSHMGTTTALTFSPTNLYDPGELEVELHFDPTETPPYGSAAETCTVTFPDGSTWVASAFMTEFQVQDPFEDKIVATATLKFSGAITITPA